MRRYIVIATGGTGGHVYPAEALALYLSNSCDTLITSDDRGAKFLKENSNYKVLKLSNIKSTSVFLHIIRIALLAYNVFNVSFSFCKRRPDAVVCFGGYASIATMLTALLFRIPIIVHEQNAVAGKVNRLISYFAAKIAISFPRTTGFSHSVLNKIVLTGLPIREELNQISKQKTLGSKDRDLFSVFIVGGSQGTKIFSTLVPSAIGMLSDIEQKKLSITHQVRQEDINEAKNLYKQTKATVEIASFFEDIGDRMKSNDLIISRAGASIIFELLLFKKPSILIPLPSAADNHQHMNAAFLSDRNASILLEQRDASPLKLCAMLREIIYNDSKLKQIHLNISKLYNASLQHSSKKLSKLVLENIK